MSEEKINSADYATTEKIAELSKVFVSLIGPKFKSVSFVLAIDDNNETLRINVEKEAIIEKFQDVFTLIISSNIIKYICDVFYIVLSDNSIFPDIGKSSNIIKIPNLHVPTWSILDLAMNNTDLAFFDDERKELHNYLFMIAIQFIMCHEAVHVLDGHSEYLLNRQKNKFAGEDVENLAPLDYQTLEYDADAIATKLIFNYLIDSKREVPEKFKNSQLNLHLFSFAISIVLYGLPGQLIKSFDEMTTKNHLGSLIRIQFFFMTITRILEYKKHSINLAEFEKITELIAADFIKLVNNEIMPQSVLEDLKKIGNVDICNHMTKISQNWFDKWFLLLKPFAHIELLK